MSAPVPDRRLIWPVPGDLTASLACLTAELDAGRLDKVDRIRSAWTLRRLVDVGDERERLDASELLRRIEGGDRLPAPPDIRGLRAWLDVHGRHQPRGAVARLARAAGVSGADLSRFRLGGSLTAEKRERLAAALIAAGLANRNRNPNKFHSATERNIRK